MKKLFYYLGLGLFSVSFYSCSNDLEFTSSEKMSNMEIQTRTIYSDSTKGQIIDVPESPYKRTNSCLYSVNENESFYDIRELDVYIIVKENSHNSSARYLTSNGVQKEMTVTAKNNSDNQKFKIYLKPLSNYIYIKDYQGHLVSMGVYANNPSTRILYVKEDTSLNGACWDFLRGEQRTFSNILENADAIKQGTGGWTDVYNEVLGVKDSKLYFDKYNNSATQEFEIRVIEEFKIIGQPTYELANVNPEEKPNYILRGTVHNNNSTSTQMTIQYSEGAKVSSSFQESKSFTTSVSNGAVIKTPIFDHNISILTSNTYGFTYSENSEKNISYMFNNTVTVEPYKTVQVTAIIKNYFVSCDYSVLVEGVNSGRQFNIYGRWEGISCADVDYNIQVMDESGKTVKALSRKGFSNKPIDLSSDGTQY